VYLLCAATAGHTQSAAVAQVVETEKAFAALAAEKGTKHAFLSNLADDGLVFLPDKMNGKAYWNGRGESGGLLSWHPNFADVSANGLLGYTTGNWEYRPKGKADQPVGFGEFVTIWQRFPDGRYRFVVDIGVEHEKPAAYSTATQYPTAPGEPNTKNYSAADSANHFFEMAAKIGLPRAYARFSDDDVRMFREGQLPIVGKGDAVSMAKKQKGRVQFAKRTMFLGSDNLAYVVSTYTLERKEKPPETGNFVQIWKLIDDRWKLVLDIFKPVPAK
jgi:ketosteroid isomerase-like protein